MSSFELPTYKDFLKTCDLDFRGVPAWLDSAPAGLTNDNNELKSLCARLRVVYGTKKFTRTMNSMRRVDCIQDIVGMQLEKYGEKFVRDPRADPRKVDNKAFFGIRSAKVSRENRALFDVQAIKSPAFAKERLEQLTRVRSSEIPKAIAQKNALDDIWRVAGFRVDVVDDGALLFTFVHGLSRTRNVKRRK